jgi:putative oxidoreductase
MKILTETNTRLIGLAILLLRCAVGVIFFMGGSGKMLGWFGGIGPEITINFYGGMGFSKFVAYLSSYTELIGGFLLIVGLLTRLAAFALVINMVVAFIVTLPHGFLTPMGASSPFSFMICVLVLLLTGPMQFSVDWLIFQRVNQAFSSTEPYLIE